MHVQYMFPLIGEGRCANAGGRLHFLVFLFMFYDVLGCSSAKSFTLYAVGLQDGPLGSGLDVPLGA